MPHQDYLNRLNAERQRPSASSGARPSTNQQRSQLGKQMRSPRVVTANNHAENSRAGTKRKVTPGSAAAKALAALEDDSSGDELSLDGDDPSPRSLEPTDTSRTPPMAQHTTPVSTTPRRQRQGQWQRDNVTDPHTAMLKRKIVIYNSRRSSPGSIASGSKNSASRSPIRGIAASINSGRSPSNGSPSAPIVGRTLSRGGTVAGECRPLNSEAPSPNVQKSNRNPVDIIDLTVDSSEDDGPPIQQRTGECHTPKKLKREENESNDAAHEQRQGGGESGDMSQTASEKNPAAKAPIVSCSLTGTLQLSETGGKRCHVIRGLWQYENRAESSPERFLLRRDIPSDCESMPLTTGGVFSGSFIYQWGLKGTPQTSLVIEESEVNISFARKEGESHSFTLNGSGQNKVGRFNLVGTARKDPSQESYNIQMRKSYIELFPSEVPQPEPIDTGKKCAGRKKRKRSLLEERSDATGDQEQGKTLSSDDSMPQVIPTSAENSNTSHESDFDEVVAGNDKEGETKTSSQSGGKAVLDQHRASLPVGAGRGPKSMLLSSSGCSPSSVTFGASACTNENGTWEEFGDLQGLSSSLTVRTLTWNLKHIKPKKYSRMTSAFFDSVGIVYVQDLLAADTDALCSDLMAFGGFKAGCGFAAWLSKIKNKRRRFHDYYSPKFAKSNIARWKESAQKWYEDAAAPGECSGGIKSDDQVGRIPSSHERDLSEGSEAISDADEQPSESVLLSSILSSHEACALRNHCNISTAQQLLDVDRTDLTRRLSGFVGSNFGGRPEKELQCIAEGMCYSWLLRAQEALQFTSSDPSPEEDADAGNAMLSRTSSQLLQTPLSYVDLKFMRCQNIACDEDLAKADPSHLARRYASYLAKHFNHFISSAAASEVTNKWRMDASLVLGMASEEDICDSLPPQNARLDRVEETDVMHSIPNLCKTVADEDNGGLPRRAIFTYDSVNHVLYEFSVSVKDSLCSKEAGKGAFLTYKGAKVLKSSSRGKVKSKNPRSAPTRKALEAVFPLSGATVSLTGANLHGDEHHYGPETDDSVGLHREFTLDDFVDAEDNVTFSSNHLGCALIELDRYAPLLPEDRKTDLVFGLKDFIFSHEPSSWRFDVAEKLNGHPQVVDFTDDTTGAPHNVAQSHTAMYVNEVGHNMKLVENVRSLGTSRSVSYYAHIEQPMAKGETTELLVNYHEHYETMRERRGYGKANLLDGVKSDDDDITRLQRNLKDRSDVEASIMRFTEDDIRQVIDFFRSRVWDGIVTDTSTFGTQNSNPHLLRQCIGRRRMHWLSLILRKRYIDLVGASFLEGADDEIFKRGMHVFVHDWPKDNPRPPYTGLATITSIAKDKHGRKVFELCVTEGKFIESVPEAVVTVPTDPDFEGVPNRTYVNWLKWKKNQDLPLMRQKLLTEIDLNWDASFVRNFPVETQTKILEALRWEFSEELVYLLVKNKRLSRPFDEEIWCPQSVSLFVKGLHLVSDFLLMGREKQSLCNELMGLARDAANATRKIAQKCADGGVNQELLCDLAFVVPSNEHDNRREVVVESLDQNRMATEDWLKNPLPLDLEWYLTTQVVLAIHPLATLIDWAPNSGTGTPLYSIDNLRQHIGLTDASYFNFYATKQSELLSLL